MLNIFFISDIKPNKYPVINARNYKWVPIHEKLTYERLSELWNIHRPVCIYTYGDISCNNILSSNFQIRKRWIHLTSLDPVNIISNVSSTILGHQYDKDYPLISVITSTYNSSHKILRPYNSLKQQTYTNWEWVVWDDSEDNNVTYNNLIGFQKTDFRIRVYKSHQHSGYIGEMKRLAAGSSYGSILVEIDHDDEIHPNLLQWIVDASKEYPDADFFYCDCAELNENTYESVSYGEFFGYGYSAHINEWSDRHKCYITSAHAPIKNPVTVRHIIGSPNHVRAWKTSFYDKIGKHNPHLKVADDYDLIVRSYIYGNWCHIRKCGYYQYRNADGNFTFILNDLIQDNCAYIFNHYKHLIPNVDDPLLNDPLWKFDKNIYAKDHVDYIPDKPKRTIVLSDPTIEDIKSYIHEDKPNNNGDMIYVLGKLPDDIPDNWKKYVSWWNLSSKDKNDRIRYIKHYFHIADEFIVN
jgi:glycosyltransferase involved in cell wall biosynthesis